MSDLYQTLLVLLQLFAWALAATVLAGLLFAAALSHPAGLAGRLRARRRRRSAIPLAWIA